MSAFEERREQDVQKLRMLAGQPRSPLTIARVAGKPPSEIDLELRLKTAPSGNYPASTQDVTRFTVTLPAKYPLVEPIITVKTPIFHPNVYTSGRICLGMKWLPTNGLELLIKRVAQIVVFDPAILNEESPANREALEWYRDARRRNPAAFPTDAWNTVPAPESRKAMKWSDLPSAPPKTVVQCTSCGTQLSLPTGRRGTVKCPRCGQSFEAQT